MSIDDLLDFTELPNVDHLQYKLIRVISLKLVFVRQRRLQGDLICNRITSSWKLYKTRAYV